MDMEEKTQRFDPNYKKGLTAQEVALREDQGLVNVTQDKITKTNMQIIYDNLFTLFNGFNFAIGLCLAMVGSWVNMTYILIIISNIFIGIVQEIRSRNMVENLSLISAIKSTVVRDCKECAVQVEELVLDDITILETGSQICADSIVVHGEIEVNESLLTGEADAITKQAGDLLLSGSFVVSGKCYAKVEKVGKDNFASQIVMEAKQHKRAVSELISSMRKVTKFTGFFIVPFGIILFWESYLVRTPSLGLKESVTTSAAALLGILPKGLVLLITFALIMALIHLSRKNILVQGLHATETLAHVDLLCLDKTGTITEGKMGVAGLHAVNEKVMPVPIEKAIRLYVGASEDNNGTFFAIKEYFGADNSAQIISRIPFSSERKWGCVVLKDIGTLVLGAPEKLFSSDQFQLPGEAVAAGRAGNRVLCFGYSQASPIDGRLPAITPVAAVVLNDPIRKNAKETLDFFKQEGVDVKIISGDNPVTVSSVAKQAGLEGYANYIDLSAVNDEKALNEAAKKYNIFGRVTPKQKRQLVKAFKAKGHTVAMTGDGVNDVLALKEADCSIAMAAGSSASRQVSQLVLLDSEFSSLPDVVMEGRRVINNTTRFGSVFLIKTILSFLLAAVGIMTLMPYPFIPIQVTLYDAMIEGYFTFVMSFERNIERVRGTFLKNVISRALPYAVVTLINILIAQTLYPKLGLTISQSESVMYYLTASIGMLAAIKSSWPFNKLRSFTCVTTVIGFFMAAYLFADLLSLEWFTSRMLIVFLSAVALSIPVLISLTVVVNKLFKKNRSLKTRRQ